MTLPTWRSRANVYQTGARLLFYVVFYAQILAEYSSNVKLDSYLNCPLSYNSSISFSNISVN